jgi:hypothetical protein
MTEQRKKPRKKKRKKEKKSVKEEIRKFDYNCERLQLRKDRRA